MKKSILYLSLITVLTVGFSSCNLDSYSDATPQILIAGYASLNSDSTIHFGVNQDYTANTLDTIEVGDTVTIYTGVSSTVNYLQKFYTTLSNYTNAALYVPDSVRTNFSQKSDFETGEFFFNAENIVYMTYALHIVALKPTDKLTITIGAVNNATRVSNTSEIKIELPIKE